MADEILKNARGAKRLCLLVISSKISVGEMVFVSIVGTARRNDGKTEWMQTEKNSMNKDGKGGVLFRGGKTKNSKAKHDTLLEMQLVKES